MNMHVLCALSIPFRLSLTVLSHIQSIKMHNAKPYFVLLITFSFLYFYFKLLKPTGLKDVFVVFSSDSKDLYSFFLPLTAYMWIHVVGFTPIIILINDIPHCPMNRSKEEEDEGNVCNESSNSWIQVPLQTFIYQSLLRFGVEERNIIILDPDLRYPDNLGTLSQAGRLFAAALPHVKNSKFLMTSDSDLWPLQSDIYRQTLNQRSQRILILNAFCCSFHNLNDKSFREYPVSHIGMSGPIWTEVMNIPEIDLNIDVNIQYRDIINDRLRQELSYGVENVADLQANKSHGANTPY